MFADFTKKSFSQSEKLKNKDVKLIHQELIESYPAFSEVFESVGSGEVTELKTANRTTFVAVDGVLRYLSYYNSAFHPMLRLLHEYPEMGKYIEVDGGAVRAMLNGAQLMAPGVISVDENLKVGDLAALRVIGGEACAIVKLIQPRSDLLKTGRSGAAVDTITIIGDGLWEAGDKL